MLWKCTEVKCFTQISARWLGRSRGESGRYLSFRTISATGSPTVIAAAITSRQDKNRLPTHIGVRANRCGLAKDSIVLTEQIRTLDKRRLRERAGRIPEDDMRRVDEALGVSMGLHDQPVAQSTHMDGGYF